MDAESCLIFLILGGLFAFVVGASLIASHNSEISRSGIIISIALSLIWIAGLVKFILYSTTEIQYQTPFEKNVVEVDGAAFINVLGEGHNINELLQTNAETGDKVKIYIPESNYSGIKWSSASNSSNWKINLIRKNEKSQMSEAPLQEKN